MKRVGLNSMFVAVSVLPVFGSVDFSNPSKPEINWEYHVAQSDPIWTTGIGDHWADGIRVFPAMPQHWLEETIFHKLRTEGAFLVSAEYARGTTQWIRLESLAGEPLVRQTDMPEFKAVGKVQPDFQSLEGSQGQKRWKIDLKKGETVLLKVQEGAGL